MLWGSRLPSKIEDLLGACAKISTSIMHTLDITNTTFSDPVIDGLNWVIPRLPGVVLLLLVGILVIRVVVRLLRFILSVTVVHVALRGVLVSVIEIFMWLFLSVKLLEALGFQNIVVLLTGSIAALGLAMAAGGSTLVSDIIAGIFLARDVDFDVGDEVIAGETPTRGVVESMDARRTRIRDQDGVLHVIPNSVVERKEWVLVRKGQDASILARAVKRAGKKVRRAALDTAVVVEKKALRTSKKLSLRKKAPSQPKVARPTITE